MRPFSAYAAILALGLSAAPVQAACDMTASAGPAVGSTRVKASASGLPALYFHADMDVNTDGAARSYHPRDPRGQTLALNNIANAISAIYDASGQRIDCSPRRGTCFTRYIQTFEAARDARWNPNGHPRVATRHMIPWKHDPALGWSAPCTIASGSFAGYFVSQTSKPADATRGECDQDRYVDSMTIPAIVLPSGVAWRSQGVVADEFDLVAVRDRQSGTLRYAIVGDRGPAGKTGEGSVALTAALRGQVLTGQETYAQIKRLALADVDYLIFPTYDVKRREPGPVTQAKIDRWGAEAFAAWGGETRLAACRAGG